jgi:beta-N-acetylhexosaminidase
MSQDATVRKKKSAFYSLFLLSCICLLSGCSSLSFGGNSSPGGKIIAAAVDVNPTETRAQGILDKMSLDEKLAQMIMVDYVGFDYAGTGLQQMVAQQQVGAVLYQPDDHNFDYPNDSIDSISAYSAQIEADGKVPALIAIDEEGGDVDKINQLFPAAPSEEELTQSGDPNTAYDQAKLDATELKQLGINVDLAPVIDVGPDTTIYGTRLFSDDPNTVATYAGNFVKGLQDNGVIGTLKHFPGLGSSDAVDPHEALPSVTKSLTDLQQSDFVPYQKIIQQNNPAMVMTTDVDTAALDPTPNMPGELSPKVLAYLRNTLKFNGVIITDALNMGGLYPDLESALPSDDQMAQVSVQAVEAGNDMIEAASKPEQVTDDITTLEAAIQHGDIKQSQIDQSVMRILMMKIKYGIIK